ncbi:MAG: GNAT family N-acetyltransferase [Verrucomicrobiaceae bacterium]
MRSPGELRPKRSSDEHFRIFECTVPQWQFNRFLYLTVGEAWAWNDKRGWPDEKWRDYVGSGGVRTFAAYYDGSPAGYYELHRSETAEVEIGYIGLLPAFFGRGFGGALLTSAIEEAWRMQPERVWVHTCTLDHPAALQNYEARGMKVWKTEASES